MKTHEIIAIKSVIWLIKEYRAEITAKEMNDHIGKVKTMIGYFIISKDTYTKNNQLMQFGHFMDSNGNTFDTTHFPPSLRKYPLIGRGFYLMKDR